MTNQRKKIFDALSTVLLVVLVLLFVVLAVPRLFGLRAYSVVSDSMEPMYMKGDLIYVKEVDPHQLSTGDVITYMVSRDTVETSRILRIIPDSVDAEVLRFQIKVAAGESTDPVHENNVLGEPVFSLAFLGFAASFFSRPLGIVTVVLLVAALLALLFVPGMLEKKAARERARRRRRRPGANAQRTAPSRPPQERTPAVKQPDAPGPAVNAFPAADVEARAEPVQILPQTETEPDDGPDIIIPSLLVVPDEDEIEYAFSRLKAHSGKPTAGRARPAKKTAAAPVPVQPPAEAQSPAEAQPPVEAPEPESEAPVSGFRVMRPKVLTEESAAKLNPNAETFDLDYFLADLKEDLGI